MPRAWSRPSGAPAPSTAWTYRHSRARCTASSARTAPARPPPSGSCSACCGPTAGAVAAARRRPVGRRDRAAPPARLRARRRHPVAEPDRRRGDRPARPAARRASDRKPPRRADRAVRAGPAQEAAAPTPRATGRRSRWSPRWPSDVELLILDEPTSGLDPLMEAVFRESSARSSSAAAGPCCCPATSCPRSRRSATGSRIIRDGRTVESGTLAELRHLTRTIDRGRAGRPAGRPGTLPGVHDLQRRRHRGPLRRRHRTRSTRCCGTLAEVGVRSLTSQPPTLEELFLRHYQEVDAK